MKPIYRAKADPLSSLDANHTDNNNSNDYGSAVRGVPVSIGSHPLYADKTELATKFVVQGYKDVWAAVLFIVGNAIVLGLGGYHYVLYSNGTIVLPEAWTTTTTNNNNNGNSAGSSAPSVSSLLLPGSTPFTFAVAMVLTSLAAVVFMMINLALFVHRPRQGIIISNVFAALWFVFQAFVLLSSGQVLFGFILLGLSVLNGLALWWWWGRIAFSAILLKTASRIVVTYNALSHTALGMMLLTVLYTIPWAFMLLPSAIRQYHAINAAREQQQHQLNINNNNSHRHHVDVQLDPADTLLSLFGLLMFYWTTQVACTIPHVTASGVTATWYFCGGGSNSNNNNNSNKMPHNPTLHSLKRACTTSFGSICFGSLLVAILEVLRHLANRARHGTDGSDSVVACILECIISCVQSLLEYFNRYAFVYCAIYGHSYLEAASRTRELCKNSLFAALFNDSLVQVTLWMTALGSAVSTGVIVWVFTNTALALLASCAVAWLSLIVFKNIDSALVTLFVCYCEEPQSLAVSNPELFAAIQSADLAGLTGGEAVV